MGATWQPFIGPRGTFPLPKICHVSPNYSSSCQPITMCHVIKLPSHLPRVPRHHSRSPHVSTVRPCHVSSTACPVSIKFFFTCLARRTDRDNFSIRTPFAKINIPPESGERDGRNGTIFVAFRAL
jgi:hypothetical protein